MRETYENAEWPTIGLLALTYAVFALGTTIFWMALPPLAILVVAVAIAQHSSLQHEVLHGHPTDNPTLNHLMVFPALGLLYPFLRFQETHLKHHHDPALTDPYDDPESNFMDPAVWDSLTPQQQRLHQFNQTLGGRMLVGPALSWWAFAKADYAAIKGGDQRIALAWALHGIGVMMVLWWLAHTGGMPLWAWVVSAYLGASLLKIRTFLEHRAHEKFRARTVIIEDKGPLAFLFLNNNLHVVHHMHPKEPWYKLPALYAARRDHYQRRNEAYVYKSYAEVFQKYFTKAKDPVPHPVWPVDKGGSDPGEPIEATTEPLRSAAPEKPAKAKAPEAPAPEPAAPAEPEDTVDVTVLEPEEPEDKPADEKPAAKTAAKGRKPKA